MAQNFKRRDLLICMHSTWGNEGRVVRVVDDKFDADSPDYKDWPHLEGSDIVVQCMSDVPLRFMVKHKEDQGLPEVIESTVGAAISDDYCLLCFGTDLTVI